MASPEGDPMTLLLKIPGILQQDMHKSVYEKLCCIYPEGKRLRAWGCLLPQDDPRLNSIFELLNTAGYSPWTQTFRPKGPREYSAEWIREYSAADLDSANYFEPRPKAYPEDFRRFEDGQLHLGMKDFLEDGNDPSQLTIALAGPSTIVVSSDLRDQIEPQGLTHIIFKPIVLVGQWIVDANPRSWEGFGHPFWEMTSDLILPPLAASTPLVDRTGKHYSGNPATGCLSNERGLFSIKISPLELHYAASLIHGVEPFDLGWTREQFGSAPNPYNRSLVTSRRFYNFCQLAKLNIDWIPVRIDPD
jgi:hypothetical protein